MCWLLPGSFEPPPLHPPPSPPTAQPHPLPPPIVLPGSASHKLRLFASRTVGRLATTKQSCSTACPTASTTSEPCRLAAGCVRIPQKMPPSPRRHSGHCTCAQGAVSTKRRKRYDSSVASKTGNRDGLGGGSKARLCVFYFVGGGEVCTRPWGSALLACGGAYWPLAFKPSAMTSRHPHYCGHPPAFPPGRHRLGGGGLS